MTTPVVNAGILYLDQYEPHENWLKEIQNDNAREVFLNIGDRPIEEVLKEAVKIRDRIQSVESILEPVVIGPVKQDDWSKVEANSHLLIRATDQTYDDYWNTRLARRQRIDELRREAGGGTAPAR